MNYQLKNILRGYRCHLPHNLSMVVNKIFQGLCFFVQNGANNNSSSKND